jgi:DNA-binding MarR family transcriptional regulator
MAESDDGEGPGDASLVYVIGRVNQGIRREMRERLAEFDLSVPEYTALSVLHARPGLSNAQLARRSLLAPQSMLEVLARLERRGLVRREVDPGHGRILRAALTAAGRGVLAQADPAIRELQEWLLADVPGPDRAILLKGMRRAMERLSDEIATAAQAAAPHSP